MKTYQSLIILDKNNDKIGELMTASVSEILKYIAKGFKVIEKGTNTELTEEMLNETIGVSDGLINIC